MAHSDAPGSNGTYNYEHFTAAELTGDLREYPTRGPRAGEEAPRFHLRDTDGREWRLEELLGRPVVLVTGSASCPMTRGSMPALKRVFEEFRDDVHWFTLYVREQHPGEKLPAHTSYEQKVDHAQFLQRAENVPWPILVDALDGSIHQAYGSLPNAAFLIGTDGRIALRQRIAHAPTLQRGLEALLTAGGQGTVLGGDDGRLHLLGTTAFGWRAIERAGEIAVRDVMTTLPPLAANLRIGARVAPALGPLARRSHRLPLGVRAGLTAAVALLASVGLWSVLRGLRR